MAKVFDKRDDGVVVVIGSGAGGGTLSRELSSAGINVVCLEAGGPVDRIETDASRMFGRLTWFDKRIGSGDLPADFPVWSGKNVGGTTLHWTGSTPRIPEGEFAPREGRRINRTFHRPARAGDADLAKATPQRLVSHDLGDVQAWERQRLAQRLERHVGGVVGTDPKRRVGRGQTLRSMDKARRDGCEIAAIPVGDAGTHLFDVHDDVGMMMRAKSALAFVTGLEKTQRSAFSCGQYADAFHPLGSEMVAHHRGASLTRNPPRLRGGIAASCLRAAIVRQKSTGAARMQPMTRAKISLFDEPWRAEDGAKPNGPGRSSL
jgi:hypothetical protein